MSNIPSGIKTNINTAFDALKVLNKQKGQSAVTLQIDRKIEADRKAVFDYIELILNQLLTK